LYTTWHAGRDAAPTSRQAIRNVTGVPESTQRTYDTTAKTRRVANIATGAAATQETYQDAAWQHGHAAFQTTIKGQTVTAWQLPSSYQAAYDNAPKGRQRKHNRRISLVNRGTRGNGSELVKRYYQRAGQAAYAVSRGGREVYWRAGRVLTVSASVPPRLSGADLWHGMG
jgi:hypothetical protein